MEENSIATEMETKQELNRWDQEQKEKKDKPVFRIDDRRIATRLRDQPQTSLEEISPGEAAEKQYPSYVEELKARCEAAEKRLEEKIQWMAEEISRTRDRLNRDFEKKLESEKQRIANSFLDVADTFELALESMHNNDNQAPFWEGIKLIQNSFYSKFQALGIARLDLKDQPFDPNLCEALSIEEVSRPEADGLVVRVILPGYTMGEKLLRPAKVMVGRYSG